MIDANLMCSLTLLIFLIRGKRMLYLLRRRRDELWCSSSLLWLKKFDCSLEVNVYLEMKGERKLHRVFSSSFFCLQLAPYCWGYDTLLLVLL